MESAFFHVPIHPKQSKFFASHLALPHLALPLFVKNKFIELQPGGYFVCSRPDLAPLVPSAQTPLHLRHLYHQVVEFSHAALPLGWTSSPRIWTSVMSVVAAALRRHGMRTLLYVDDLLIACSSFEEASRARQIIEDTLLAAGIVRAPLKGCFDTPTQTLPDHLGFIISSIGKGALRVPERRCVALRRPARALLFEAAKNRRLVDSDLLRRFSGAAISCWPAVPLARFHLREVFNAQEQYKPRSFFPLSSSCRQPALLAQLFRQESPENLQELWPDQPSTALYNDASGTTGWVSVSEPPHEATRSSTGWWASQEVLEMIALKELKACRHGLHQNVEALRGQALPGQPGQAVCGVLRKMSSKCPASTHGRDQGHRSLAPRKQDPPQRGLHSKRSKLGRCAIAPTGSRHVVLAAAHATRALAPDRVDIGLAGLHRSLGLQAERSGSKICHSSPLSSQCSFQRLAPRLVEARHALAKPTMASTASSFGKNIVPQARPYKAS